MNYKEQLLTFNRRGLIHGPDESDDSFFRRCRLASLTLSSPSSPLAQTLFDISPDWVWMIYANKGLRFWEGGCTWTKRDHITLQLNKEFEKKSHYFGYSRDEVVAHELVHVVRSHFEEPIFEEILAYQSSTSRFRRLFAPIFRSSKESVFFMAVLTALFFSNLFELFQNAALFGFVVLLLGGFARLFWAQSIFLRTKKKLTRLVGKGNVLAVMIRLTDREIIRFAKMKDDQIAAYARKMAKIQLRWVQINGCYFSNG